MCFLIYDTINHEQLWYDWLTNVDKQKYNIYIHYKEDKPLQYFEQYKLKNTIPTKWCDVSIIHAHNRLFQEAYNEHNNYKIISLSQSCIPVKSFDYIYHQLTKDNYGYMNRASHSQNFPKCNSLLRFYPKQIIQKSSNWFIINRTLTKAILSMNKKRINTLYQPIFCPEEHYYITTIYSHKLQNELKMTPNLSYATTFAAWPDTNDYQTFRGSVLSKNSPNEYKRISNKELQSLINSQSFFARKFLPECDLQYLYKHLLNKKD